MMIFLISSKDCFESMKEKSGNLAPKRSCSDLIEEAKIRDFDVIKSIYFFSVLPCIYTMETTQIFF